LTLPPIDDVHCERKATRMTAPTTELHDRNLPSQIFASHMAYATWMRIEVSSLSLWPDRQMVLVKATFRVTYNI